MGPPGECPPALELVYLVSTGDRVAHHACRQVPQSHPLGTAVPGATLSAAVPGLSNAVPTMTAHERVLATIHGQPADRVPVDVWLAPEVLAELQAHAGEQDELRLYQKIGVEFHPDGAVRELVPRLIECGIDILNPIQRACPGMDRGALAQDFGGQVIFHGGVTGPTPRELTPSRVVRLGSGHPLIARDQQRAPS